MPSRFQGGIITYMCSDVCTMFRLDPPIFLMSKRLMIKVHE